MTEAERSQIVHPQVSGRRLVQRCVGGIPSWLARHCTATIVSLHVWSLIVFGPTVWSDSASYVQLAKAFGPQGFKRVYSGANLWWFAYVGPGMPGAWGVLRHVPTSGIWPVWAVLQRVIAIGSLVYAVRRIQPQSNLPKLAAIFLCCIPFYQAMHNSFMTESIESSIFLVCFAISVRCIQDRAISSRQLCSLVSLAYFQSLFRIDAALAEVALGLVAALFCTKKIRNSLALLVAGLVCLSWFSLFRYAMTGVWISPRSGAGALYVAPQVNPKLSETAVQAFVRSPWRSEFVDSIKPGKRLSSEEIEAAGYKWRSDGLSDQQIMARFESTAWLIRHDSFSTELRSLLVAGTALGINTPCIVTATSSYPLVRGKTARESCDDFDYYYKFFSGLGEGNSLESLEKYLWKPLFEASGDDDLRLFASAWKKWLQPPRVWLRDPFRISNIDPSVFATLAIICALLLLRISRGLSLCCIVLPGTKFLTCAILPFAGIRHAQALLPVYALSIAATPGWLNPTSGRRHLPTSRWN